MINKPKGVITTLAEDEDRPTIKDFLRNIRYRVFPLEGLTLTQRDSPAYK